MQPTLSYYDQRYGDTYEIFLNSEGVFVEALRYVDQIGRDPIVYDELYHIPKVHQHAIEELIHKWKPTPSPKS